jgi:hypothetical protein
MVAGPWEVRIASAQSVAKIGVRSGEPFRVQCYSILATARGRAPGEGGGGGGGTTAAGAAGGGAAVAAAAEGSDPLGVAACVGPALEVLDHMYSGAARGRFTI